jgi:hypothetical protein
VSKPVLGRGLGNLLKGGAAPPPAAQPEQPAQPNLPNLSPGMATLLRGSNGDAESENEPRPAAPPPISLNRKLLMLSLVLADLVLIIILARMAFRTEGHFGFVEVVLSVIGMTIGAWLSCLALSLKR